MEDVKTRFTKIVDTIENSVRVDKAGKYFDASALHNICSEAFKDAGVFENERGYNAIFRFFVGENVMDYVRERRVMYVYEMMLDWTKYDANQLAYYLGVTSDNKLLDKIKKYFAYPPKQLYKEQNRNLIKKKIEWEDLSCTKDIAMDNYGKENENMSYVKFNVDCEKLSEAEKALDLESFYNMNRIESGLAFEISKKYGLALEKTFEYISNYLWEYIESDDPDDETRDDQLVKDLKNEEVIYMYFTAKLTHDEIRHLLYKKYSNQLDKNITDYTPVELTKVIESDREKINFFALDESLLDSHLSNSRYQLFEINPNGVETEAIYDYITGVVYYDDFYDSTEMDYNAWQLFMLGEENYMEMAEQLAEMDMEYMCSDEYKNECSTHYAEENDYDYDEYLNYEQEEKKWDINYKKALITVFKILERSDVLEKVKQAIDQKNSEALKKIYVDAGIEETIIDVESQLNVHVKPKMLLPLIEEALNTNDKKLSKPFNGYGVDEHTVYENGESLYQKLLTDCFDYSQAIAFIDEYLRKKEFNKTLTEKQKLARDGIKIKGLKVGRNIVYSKKIDDEMFEFNIKLDQRAVDMGYCCIKQPIELYDKQNVSDGMSILINKDQTVNVTIDIWKEIIYGNIIPVGFELEKISIPEVFQHEFLPITNEEIRTAELLREYLKSNKYLI